MKNDPYHMKNFENEFKRENQRKKRDFKTRVFILIIIAIFCLTIGYLVNMNFVARKFGGDITVNLQTNEKLVNITWKNSNMWILTRPMKSDEEAETYTFYEDSNCGIFEGKVTLIESKTND